MTVSESLLQITNLTRQNLQILQLINEAFHTKANHLSTTVGDTAYTIPSYIALENKVNHLQDAFNNLVHAAESGEAWFNFDGNSKEIRVGGFQQAPNPIQIQTTRFFHTDVRPLFKDMLTPTPYIRFDMNALSDDITKVLVRKIIPYDSEILSRLHAASDPSITDTDQAMSILEWSDVKRILESGSRQFTPGVDYLEYETEYSLPIRKNIRMGHYAVETVLEDRIDANLENILTLKIHASTPLKTKDQDGLLEKDLTTGDCLVTFDGSSKLEILSIQPVTGTIQVKVLSGEYVNLIGCGALDMNEDELWGNISDYSKLNLYSSISNDRYLQIPMEEDQFVYLSIAPINTRINTIPAWGQGLWINVDHLKLDTSDGMGFRDYYNQNVNNIGDAIIEFSNISFPSITRYSEDEMQAFYTAPVVENKTLQVVQINRHLNDSKSIQNIRTLYSQKKQYQLDLDEIQARIRTLNDELLSISFDDMSGTRSAITAQISDLKSQQNNLVTSLAKITESISVAANNSEIPIEDAKFRVRGYIDVDKYVDGLLSSFSGNMDRIILANQLKGNVVGVQCRYRYKNPDIPQANVSVVDNYLISEWNLYNPPHRERTMSYEDGQYRITYQDTDKSDTGAISFNKTSNINKFNQVDIPISQGEVVELQARILWGFGYPFVTTYTAWSDPVDITFPSELTKDVQVTTIIEENNSDIEAGRFENILADHGVTEHIGDKVDDQDTIFWHKPESISSGFFTSERRVIPLKDKLVELTNNIQNLMDSVQGTFSSAIAVTFICDNIENVLQADVQNVVQLPAYGSVQEIDKNIPSGSAYNKGGVVYVTGQIKIANTTQHTVRLFPVIPGPRDKFISGDNGIVYTPYSESLNKCWKNPEDGNTGTCIIFSQGSGDDISTLQRGNQMILFCRANPYNTQSYGDYVDQKPGSDGDYATTHDRDGYRTNPEELTGLMYYPSTISKYGLCLESDAVSAKFEMAPGESLVIPILIEYNLGSITEDSKLCGISIRTSLYQDPLYYEFLMVAKQNQSTADKLVAAKSLQSTGIKYNTVVR